MFINKEGVFPLLDDQITVIKLSYITPGDFLRHGQRYLLHFRLRFRHVRYRFRDHFLDRGGGGRYRDGRLGELGNHHIFPQRHIGRALHLGGGGDGGLLLGFGCICQGGREGAIFFCGHGPEERLFLRRRCFHGRIGFGVRCNRLCRCCGRSLGFELHLRTIRCFVQRTQNAVMDAIKHSFFRKEFYFRLSRMNIHIHCRCR